MIFSCKWLWIKILSITVVISHSHQFTTNVVCGGVATSDLQVKLVDTLLHGNKFFNFNSYSLQFTSHGHVIIPKPP